MKKQKSTVVKSRRKCYRSSIWTIVFIFLQYFNVTRTTSIPILRLGCCALLTLLNCLRVLDRAWISLLFKMTFWVTSAQAHLLTTRMPSQFLIFFGVFYFSQRNHRILQECNSHWISLSLAEVRNHVFAFATLQISCHTLSCLWKTSQRNFSRISLIFFLCQQNILLKFRTITLCSF